MKKSRQDTQTHYEILKKSSRVSPLPEPNNPLTSVRSPGAVNYQSQPEQQSQAHESSEGQRRAEQLMDEYSDDINVDEYDFDDEIQIQSRPIPYDKVDRGSRRKKPGL